MRERRASEEQRRATAYHEAGHAVVAYDQRIKVTTATIVPDSVNGTDGLVTHDPIRLESLKLDIDHIPPRVRDQMERQARIYFAGEIAQRKFNPRSLRFHHSHDDRRSAMNLISRLTSSDRELGAWLKLLRIQTEEIVYQDYRWAQVEAVANALMRRGTLAGGVIRSVIQQALQGYLDAKREAFASTAAQSATH